MSADFGIVWDVRVVQALSFPDHALSVFASHRPEEMENSGLVVSESFDRAGNGGSVGADQLVDCAALANC